MPCLQLVESTPGRTCKPIKPLWLSYGAGDLTGAVNTVRPGLSQLYLPAALEGVLQRHANKRVLVVSEPGQLLLIRLL